MDEKFRGELRVTEAHRPSSFEGALWTVYGIKDGLTIYHSPTGCYLMQNTQLAISEFYRDLYCTLLSHAELIKGTEARLEDVLKEVAAKRSKAIFVVTSPCVEVVGDDVEGIVDKVGLKKCVVIRPPLGGLMHDGQEKAFLSLMSLVKPAKQKFKRAVNVIGPTYYVYNWKADLFEIKRILSNIGVSVNSVLTADSTVGEIEQASAASLNLLMYPYDCGVETARFMEKEYGIPYIANHIPIGWGETSLWLKDIAKFFGIDATNYIREEVEDGFEIIRETIVPAVGLETSVAIATENNDTYGVGISHFLKDELGLDIQMIAVGTEAAKVKAQELCDNVLVSPIIDEKRKQYQEKTPLIIFGNWYDFKVSKDLGFQNFVFADVPLIGNVPRRCTPFMGFLGAENLTHLVIDQVLTNILIETKGGMVEAISAEQLPWDADAKKLLWEVSELIPTFVRPVAIKKMEKRAVDIAMQRKSKVTVEIIKTSLLESIPDKRLLARLDDIFKKYRAS